LDLDARTCLYNAAENSPIHGLPEGLRLGLNRVDLLIIAVYLAGITLFGLRFRKRQRSMRDYFLADRNIPWWAIALSIVAAETSTLTIISIPGLAYDSNLTFLQVVMGYVVGRVIISFVLLPHYFRGDLFTAYQLIERRFGPRLRSVTAALFLLTRAAAEGVRVYAVSIVVSIALGTGEVESIAIITVLTLIYTFEGGLAAVIWTDVVQTFIYVGGTIVGVFTIAHLVPGGWSSVQEVAGSLHKFQVFDLPTIGHWPYLNLVKPYTLWAGILGGAFLTTASHGTDQLIVQRLLAARNQRQSVTALLASGVAILFQFALFLIVGVMLFVYYRLPSAAFGRADRIYPTFIVSRMPHGISGLLIAAILAAAMSNLSAALNSLSSSAMMDFYFRFRPVADEKKQLRISRLMTVFWALVLFALAVIALHRVGRVVEVGLQIASVAYGALLGVFLLGVLTRRANQNGAMAGMLCGFGVELYLWRWSQVPFTWWVAIGTCVTFGVGYAASFGSMQRKSFEPQGTQGRTGKPEDHTD
jgi:solute:Na+ symporter, SSS family